MVKPVTSEDTRRDESLSNRIRNVGDLLNLINDKEIVDSLPRLKIIAQLMVDYLSQQDIADVLNEIIKEKEEDIEAQEENGEGEDDETFDNISSSGGISSRPKPGVGLGGPGEEEDETPNLEDLKDTEVPNLGANSPDEIDLSEIEGQDLV